MSSYITVDGGTTNTRISLVEDLNVKDTLKFNIGIGKAMNDNRILYKTLKTGIDEIISKNNIKKHDIAKILVSGMLTSEFGLINLEHITVPAGIKELHCSMTEKVIEEISDIPMVFIRGVKTRCSDLDNADMMRGEECELFGLSDNNPESSVYILPGSHSKIIETDTEGRIINLTTLLTGEMIAALSGGTILKNAIELDSELDEEYLLVGYEYCLKNGLNKSVFKTRVLKNMFSKTNSQVYSFFMGVLLCEEITEILRHNPKKTIIAGKKQIKEATYMILSKKTDSPILKISDENVDTANTMGMVKIFEFTSTDK